MQKNNGIYLNIQINAREFKTVAWQLDEYFVQTSDVAKHGMFTNDCIRFSRKEN